MMTDSALHWEKEGWGCLYSIPYPFRGCRLLVQDTYTFSNTLSYSSYYGSTLRSEAGGHSGFRS